MKHVPSINNLKQNLKTAKGKNILQFTLFIGISFIFWFAITLNEEFQFDINYPVKIKDIPDSITLISSPPKTVKVNINSKGYYFFKYKLKDVPSIDIDFKKYRQGSRISLGHAEMLSVTRQMFGINSRATTFSPDSINVDFTSKPGKKVKLKINIEPTTEGKYIINGPIKSNLEDILLYSVNDIPTKIDELETEIIHCDNLTKTTTLRARIITPKGMRAIPDSVDITIPVEPLISKKRITPIEVINTPEERRLITFPSQIEVSYLIPKSLFNNEVKHIKAVVDYKDIYLYSNKLPIKLIEIPSTYKGVSTKIDSVEYIIEQ